MLRSNGRRRLWIRLTTAGCCLVVGTLAGCQGFGKQSEPTYAEEPPISDDANGEIEQEWQEVRKFSAAQRGTRPEDAPQKKNWLSFSAFEDPRVNEINKSLGY